MRWDGKQAWDEADATDQTASERLWAVARSLHDANRGINGYEKHTQQQLQRLSGRTVKRVRHLIGLWERFGDQHTTMAFHEAESVIECERTEARMQAVYLDPVSQLSDERLLEELGKRPHVLQRAFHENAFNEMSEADDAPEEATPAGHVTPEVPPPFTPSTPFTPSAPPPPSDDAEPSSGEDQQAIVNQRARAMVLQKLNKIEEAMRWVPVILSASQALETSGAWKPGDEMDHAGAYERTRVHFEMLAMVPTIARYLERGSATRTAA